MENKFLKYNYENVRNVQIIIYPVNKLQHKPKICIRRIKSYNPIELISCKIETLRL